MKNRIDFLGIPIDALTMQETINKIENTILSNRQIHHSVVNAGKIVLMQNDEKLNKSVLEADLINADGQAVVWGARLLGKNIPERVSGIDLMEKLIAISSKKKYKCFFFGAEESVVSNLVEKYSSLYSQDIIAGYLNGYYSKKDEKKVVQEIVASKANILFVAITSPKKEIFLNKYKNEFRNINFIMGVGGSFDVISGKIKRAPIYMQKIGLEWLYRFFQEPQRMWKRYLFGNIQFIYLVIKNKLKYNC